ncbi:MAG TPA: O-antigen ligase family protein [Chitinivibrionales bacterium]|nr:O-antigen ligase family protein [Chitinivibrionales bacterium]
MGRILTVCFLCFVMMSTEVPRSLKTFFFFFIFIATVAVYYTETRGPWIGFGLALITILIAKTKMRRYAMTLAAVIAVIAVFGVTKKFSLFEGTLFSQRQNTVVEREISYSTTYKIFLSKPVVGIGFGKFKDAWFKYFSGYTPMDFDGSHNTWLTMLCELGLIGSLFYFSIIFVMLRKTYSLFRRLDETSSFERNVVLLSLAIAVMYVVTGTFSDLRWSLLQNNVTFLFWGTVEAIKAQTNGNIEAAIPSNAFPS